ncbi:hypothetical protein HID58_080052 [Brassica napus]|uniref:Homeobox domain-containing protein n=1 Tax=Brassica napus TaxID=3708 RepID=A0ABQ7Y6M5_BRANA|nr:hypothetical protein HID58_080052 [Brassica napus]
MDGLRWFVVEMGLRLDKFSGPLRRSPSLTLAAVKKRILAFGRSVCEEEVSSGELSSPILDKKTMKKKRFHNHIQWLESYSLFFSTQLFSPSLSFSPRQIKIWFQNRRTQHRRSWIIAITAEIKMGRKLRKTTTDAVAEIVVVSCSRGALWRGEDTRGMRREIEPVV